MSARKPGEVRRSVDKTLEALGHTDSDTALITLLYSYADAMDDSVDPADAIAEYGTAFLSALRQMGATPAARAAITKSNSAGTPGAKSVDMLAELRENRAKSTG